MPKAYWIAAYRSVRDPEALAAYAKLAVPALQKAGARILARGNPAQVYDDGLNLRTVLIEFDSVAQAVAAHDSPEYQRSTSRIGQRSRPGLAHYRRLPTRPEALGGARR